MAALNVSENVEQVGHPIVASRYVWKDMSPSENLLEFFNTGKHTLHPAIVLVATQEQLKLRCTKRCLMECS